MDIVISEHAVDKFIGLNPGCKKRDSAKKTLKKMFLKSKKVKLNPTITAVRMINNKKAYNNYEYKEAEYYEFDAYRFVVVDGVAVTFEKKYK